MEGRHGERAELFAEVAVLLERQVLASQEDDPVPVDRCPQVAELPVGEAPGEVDPADHGADGARERLEAQRGAPRGGGEGHRVLQVVDRVSVRGRWAGREERGGGEEGGGRHGEGEDHDGAGHAEDAATFEHEGGEHSEAGQGEAEPPVPSVHARHHRPSAVPTARAAAATCTTSAAAVCAGAVFVAVAPGSGEVMG